MESWPALCTSLLTPWLLHLACSRPPLCPLSLLSLPDVFVAVVEAQQMLKINIRKRAVHEEKRKMENAMQF